MTNITLQANGFLLSIEVLAVVAAETTGGVLVPCVIGVAVPVGFLFRVHAAPIRFLKRLNRFDNVELVEIVIILVILAVIGFQTGDPGKGHLNRVILTGINLDGFFPDFRDIRRDTAA